MPPDFRETDVRQLVAQERRRHVRKYARGDVQDKAFHFRGPDERLNLRAQNLGLFAQIGEGVDDETWSFHLERGDYERWFRDAMKDPELADGAPLPPGEPAPGPAARFSRTPS